ncbi:MAG: MFS transporter, partial [Clostridiaceae bacterium]|nr:MFS transporter [Clostridiaceae bacterium]
SDKMESRLISSIGMLITSAALLLMSFIDASSGFAIIIASLMILGFGLALFSSPNTHAIMNSVEKRFYGIASAAIGTMRLTGQMFSMAVANLAISVYVGKVEITPQLHPALIKAEKLVFLIFAVMCFAGVFASIARGKSEGVKE